MTRFHIAGILALAVAVGAPSALRADGSPDDPATNPVLVATGKSLYAQHCSHCHGFNMVNPGTVTYDLRRFPHNDKERFIHSVIYGKAGIMPPWGDAVNLDEIEALWAYVMTGGKS